MFPDLQGIIPLLRQLVLKFPDQVEAKVSIWSKALNTDEDRVRAWIIWLKEQHASILSLSHKLSAPTATPSTGPPAVVVSQPVTRLPTPSESPEPQIALRLNTNSSSDNPERSPLFRNPFTSPVSPLLPLEACSERLPNSLGPCHIRFTNNGGACWTIAKGYSTWHIPTHATSHHLGYGHN